MKTLYESILDDEDEIMNDIGQTVIEDWFKSHTKGKYKYIKLKNGNYKFWGDLILKNSEETMLPGIHIDSFEGQLTIKNCNFESLGGLFVYQHKYLKLNISIINCPNLINLVGLPKLLEGDLTISGCTKLKDLTGIPEYIEGEINLMKNGKRFTKTYVNSLTKGMTDIYCSEDADDENMIVEAFNEPHLYRLDRHLLSIGASFRKIMKYQLNNIAWDRVTSEYVKVYKQGDKKGLTAARNIIAGKWPGMIVTLDSDRNFNLLIVEKDYLELNNSHYYGWNYKEKTTRLVYYIERAYEFWVITVPRQDHDELEGLNTYQKTKNRAEAQHGMIPTGKEYEEFCQRMARENRQRYKNTLAQMRTVKNDKIDKYSQQVENLMNRFVKFNTQVVKGKIKIEDYELSYINEYFYGKSVWQRLSTNNGRYVGEDGLTYLFSKVCEYTLNIQNGDHAATYEKELELFQNKLERLIKICDERLKKYGV